MGNYLMSKQRRDEIRSTARWTYLNAVRRFTAPYKNKPEIKRMVIGETRVALVQSGKFESIIGGIMLAIATKLIVKLIEKWLDENLFSAESLSPSFTEGEPGYVAKTK